MQIYDGTLCTRGPWEALVAFQQLLVLADQEGNVDMTAAAISRRTTIPLEIIEKGILALLLPDPESRTPTEEGRRIVPLCEGRSWGWRVVNYKHYRDLKREEDRRAYHREYWNKKRSVNKTQQTQQNSTRSTKSTEANTEANAEAEANAVKSSVEPQAASTARRQPSAPVAEVFQHWKTVRNHPTAKLGDPGSKRHRVIADRLRDGYTVDQLKRAIEGVQNSPHHRGENDRATVYDDIELICRDQKHVDMFIKFADQSPAINSLSSAGRRSYENLKNWQPPELREQAK